LGKKFGFLCRVLRGRKLEIANYVAGVSLVEAENAVKTAFNVR
jgi:hypothetical protein